MGGMLRSTAELPRQQVEFVLRVYGTLVRSGPYAPALHGKAMVWVLADRTAVVVQNDPTDGSRVIRTSLPLDRVEISAQGIRLTFPPSPYAVESELAGWQESSLGLITASCVCGAGPTGIAKPVVAPDGVYLDVVPVKSVPDWVGH